MDTATNRDAEWVGTLVQFLREQPGVAAVRLDPAAQKVAIATLGEAQPPGLARALTATLAAIEAKLGTPAPDRMPAGFSLRREGSATVLRRQSGAAEEKTWLWREMQWPDIEAGPGADDPAWRALARLAAICGMAGIAGYAAAHLAPQHPWLAIPAYLTGLVAGGWEAAITCWERLRQRKIDIHFLMLAVAAGAVVIGAWSEAVLLLFLFSASGAMEEYALHRTRSEISSLLKSSPKSAALVTADGGEELIAIEAVQVGQRLRTKPGEAFATDGVVVSGSSASDESTLTGEATPVPKAAGDRVFSGTLNLWGVVDFDVTSLPSESTLKKIIRLIQTAQKLKAPSERFIDRFGPVYTYVVIGGSAAMFLVWWLGVGLPAFTNTPETRSAFYRAMTLMVVASPCAVVLSIPSAILAAIAWGARHGVLFRGGGAIERLAEIGTVALDKTGTLTSGELAVVSWESFPQGREREILQSAFSLEAKSHHPIARAITRRAKAEGIAEQKVDEFQSLTGQGLRGSVGGTTLLLGRRELLDNGPLAAWSHRLPSTPAEFSEVWVIKNDLVGRILLKDQIRTESRSVLAQLRHLGIKTVMLTGDRRPTAEAVGRELGLDEVSAGLSPEDKVQAIERLRGEGRKVAMVGDGVNDAPCLAAADVSVAMGARGSDAALEQAEVVLMDDRIENFLAAHRLSRRARTVIRQNITLSLGVVAIMVAITIIGTVPLAVGVAAHEGSTFLVCLNSLRLLFGRND